MIDAKPEPETGMVLCLICETAFRPQHRRHLHCSTACKSEYATRSKLISEVSGQRQERDDAGTRWTPTPDDIAAVTATVRAGWSAAERRRRSVTVNRVPTPPVLSLCFVRGCKTLLSEE